MFAVQILGAIAALAAMIAVAAAVLAVADRLDARWWTGHGEFATLHLLAAISAMTGAAVGWWVSSWPTMLIFPLGFGLAVYIYALNIIPSRWRAFLLDIRARFAGRTQPKPVPPRAVHVHAWESDEPLPDLFLRIVNERLGSNPGLRLRWEGPGRHGKRTLRVERRDEEGFDVAIECLAYGLYPSAGGWLGPAWDAREPIGEVVEDIYRWLVSALSPEAKLTVRYANGRPYHWHLSARTNYGPLEYGAGNLIFNYFGTRSAREFRNHHLPAP